MCEYNDIYDIYKKPILSVILNNNYYIIHNVIITTTQLSRINLCNIISI